MSTRSLVEKPKWDHEYFIFFFGGGDVSAVLISDKNELLKKL